MSGWITALRIARREARRSRGRSLLVVAMVAIPIAALTFGAAVGDTFTLTPRETADRLMGSAQAVAVWGFDGPVHQPPAYLGFVSAGLQPGGRSQRSAPHSTDQLLALLPPGSTALPDQFGSLEMRTATGIGSIRTRMLDITAPLAQGIYRPLAGRAPADGDEATLTAAAARRLGTGVGGTVRLAGGERTFRVVGLVEDPSDLRAETMLLHPGAVPVTALSAARDQPDPIDLRWLVATPGPITWDQVKQLNTHGIAAVSRYVLAHRPSAVELYPEVRGDDSGPPPLVIVLVAGLALLEVVLLAGPAFAVGVRRRRRELALVAAAGGTPTQLRRMVLADGVVLGAAAAVVGTLFGLGVAVLGERWMEDHLAHARAGGFRVYPWALFGVLEAAVLTGLLAALVPAWIASRQDVVAALAGRRGITRSRRRWPVLGVLLLALGMGAAAAGAWRVSAPLILAGLVVLELGLVVCTPAIVGLVARLGRWLPPAPRIALRDTSRNRTAAAPAISAVMAAVVGSMAIAVVVAAQGQRARDDYRTLSQPGQVTVLPAGPGKGGFLASASDLRVASDAIRSTMPTADVYQVGRPDCSDQACFATAELPTALACPFSPDGPARPLSAADQRAARQDPRCADGRHIYQYFGAFGSVSGMTVVIDEAAAGAVLGLPAGDIAPVTAALLSGAVVVGDPRYLVGGRVTIRSRPLGPINVAAQPAPGRAVTARGYAMPHRPAAPITAMTAATARSLGLSPQPWLALATTTRMPTVAEQDRLQAVLGSGFGVFVERGAPQPAHTALVVLAIVAGVITLGAAGIATGLAAADGRADLGTLAAVGASPRVRRLLSLSQSGVIAGLGSVLGVAAGLGASTAVLFALNQRYAGVWPAPTPFPITVPWLNLGTALVVVPLVAMLGAGLLTRSRLPIERRGG